MPATRPYIIGNWKMNGLAADLGIVAEIAAAARAHPHVDVALCLPATLLREAAARAGEALAIGGQTCHARAAGAHTGEISAPMLADAGARLVMVGHSERRADRGETDADVCAQAKAALAAGLHPVVCVGESLADRDAGQAEAVVTGQLTRSLEGIDRQQVTIAYEPVWAIGTGRTASPDDVAAMHGALRAHVGPGPRLLYGGSVKPDNAAALLATAEVGGVLVGGASLKAESFAAIIAAAAAVA